MGVDMKRMHKSYQDNKSQGDFFKPQPGQTTVYIHPPCRGDKDHDEPTTGLNYIPIVVHYVKVNGKNRMITCLDQTNNPILKHPFVIRLLKKRGIKILKDGCPVCMGLSAGNLPKEVKGNLVAQTRFLWGLTPYKRIDPEGNVTKLPNVPTTYSMGKMLYNAVMKIFERAGDITDPSSAVLVVIDREGSGLNDTKYGASVDIDTIKKPKKFLKKEWAVIAKAMAEGGPCDLFNVVASQIKTQAEIKAILSGVDTEGDEEGVETEKYEEGGEEEGEYYEEGGEEEGGEYEEGGEEDYEEYGAYEGDDEETGFDDETLDELDRKIQAVQKRKEPPTKKTPSKKMAAKKTVAKKIPAKAPAKKTVAKKIPAKAPAKKIPAKAPAKKTVAKKMPAKKAPAKKIPAKAPAKKTVAKKMPAKKAPAKKIPAKAPAKKTVAKKMPAKKAPATRQPARRTPPRRGKR